METYGKFGTFSPDFTGFSPSWKWSFWLPSIGLDSWHHILLWLVWILDLFITVQAVVLGVLLAQVFINRLPSWSVSSLTSDSLCIFLHAIITNIANALLFFFPLGNNTKWTKAETAAIWEHLNSYIVNKKVPGKRACEACITASRPTLNLRSWTAVKYKVYNTIQSIKRRKWKNLIKVTILKTF